MKFKTLLLALLLILSTIALAGSPILIAPESGKYLGNLNGNRYDPNSVANPRQKHRIQRAECARQGNIDGDALIDCLHEARGW